MINGNDDFKALMQRLAAGDVAAAEEVVDRYGEHVSRAIRRRFRTQKLRVLYATEDCMQSVWGAIFANRDRMAEIPTPEHLMKFLATIAGNKLIDRDRKLRAQRNDIDRERELPDAESPEYMELAENDLTPSQKVAIEDEWEVRTHGFPTEQREVLELHRQGYSSEEIAAQTNRSGRRVRQMIQKFREWYARKSDVNDEKRESEFCTPASDDGDCRA